MQGVKYILYARKSTEDDSKQISSIDDQTKAMIIIAKRLDLNIIEILTEEKSAKDPDKRPVFKQMMGMIQEGKANGIICWKLNRLTRNQLEAGQIQHFLQRKVIASIQTESREYRPEDNALLFSVESSMATQYSIDLAKDSKRGMISKMEKGWYPHMVPQGYLNEGNNKGQKYVVKDELRFPLVKRMWQHLLAGVYSASAILKLANDEWGYRTRKGKKLSKSSLCEDIFGNIFYTGILKNTFGEFIGSHEAMISIEEFNRAQVLLGRKDRERPQKHAFDFSGLIKCRECGCSIIGEKKTKYLKKSSSTKSYTYYHCSWKKKDYRCTQRKSVNEAYLDDFFLKELDAHTIPQIFMDWAMEVIGENYSSELEERKKIKLVQQVEIDKLQKRLERLLTLRLDNEISEDAYSERKKQYEREILVLETKAKQNKFNPVNFYELAEKAFSFIVHAKLKFETGDSKTRKKILSTLGQNFFLKQGKLSYDKVFWLTPIDETVSGLVADYRRLEPPVSLSVTEKNRRLDEIRSVWLPSADSNYGQVG